jgi:putative transposase
MRFSFIDAKRAEFPVARLCEALESARVAISLGKIAPPVNASAKTWSAHIRECFCLSGETYGSPRMHADLMEDDIIAGRHRIARLMRDNGLVARQRRRFKKTTDSNHGGPIAPNHLDQDFATPAPDQKWAADISYIWTTEGWLYLAIIFDLFSRRIVGWAVSDHLKKDLALSALQRALALRQPKAGLLHHSDSKSVWASCSANERADVHSLPLTNARHDRAAPLAEQGRRPSRCRPAAYDDDRGRHPPPSWLVKKCEGDVREAAYRLLPYLSAGLLIFLIVVFTYSLAEHLEVMDMWVERPYLFIFPVIGAMAAVLLAFSVLYRWDEMPFLMVTVILLCAFGTLALSFWPYMIPFVLTIEEAAAPQSSLAFSLEVRSGRRRKITRSKGSQGVSHEDRSFYPLLHLIPCYLTHLCRRSASRRLSSWNGLATRSSDRARPDDGL